MNRSEMTPEETLARAKKDVLRLLSFRPRSVHELRTRLLQKKYNEEVIATALEYFSKQGLVDDEKYAKLYALSRIQSRPVGKNQIRRDLKNRGISPKSAENALSSIRDFDERQVALDIALRRHQHMTRLPENISKARLYGFLKRRGFTSESVFYALSKLYKGSRILHDD